MGRQIDLIAAAARTTPARAVMLPAGLIGVFSVMTDGAGYRFVPDEPTLLYSLTPGSVNTHCAIGRGTTYAGVRPNAAYNLIPAGDLYVSRTEQASHPLRFASLTFRLAELSTMLDGEEPWRFDPAPRLVVEDRRVDALVRMLAESDAMDDGDETIMRHHAFLALAALVLGRRSGQVADKGVGMLDARRMATVRAFIETNLNARITMASMANAANVSPFHFARAFKASTGLTPAAYVRARRMEHAQALLRATRYPIAEIARRVGYPDPARFAERFRRDIGTTPSAFRSG